VGSAGAIAHFDGNGWSSVGGGGANHLTAVWGSSATDVWAVGQSLQLVHFDGKTWQTSTAPTSPELASTPANLSGVWGTSPNDVWAVGAGSRSTVSTVLHFDGKAWTVTSSPKGRFYRVWSSGPTDVWLIGLGGVLHGDGHIWQAPPGAPDRVNGIWGSGADDVWLTRGRSLARPETDPATVVHWDGIRFTTVATALSDENLSGIWGSGPSDIWVIGQRELPSYDGVATALHFDGKIWTRTRTGCTNPLIGIWGSAPGDVWLVGAGDSILRHELAAR
jgi:hypothetical protein